MNPGLRDTILLLASIGFVFVGRLHAEDSPLSRCRVVPQANHEVAFLIDGAERLRWHYGTDYPRPFFFPLIGPAGSPLTRMGHPGAPNHDHHRSIWFAHNDVDGVNYWGDDTGARVRQKSWLVDEDGAEEAVMAVQIGWHPDTSAEAVMEQELVASLRPQADGETLVELQATFRAAKGRTVELNQTNFGFLAVRVAKSMTVHFGAGKITSSEGAVGEEAIFGNEARWMDYSGPVPLAAGEPGDTVMNGLTYFDHPSNPGYPSRWHVRDDGWMGASVCRTESRRVEEGKPLILRYLLHAHDGAIDVGAAERIAAAFAKSPAFEVGKSQQKHRQYGVRRVEK